MTRFILTTTLCLWGLLSVSAWSLNQYSTQERRDDTCIQNLVQHSFDWQNILAEEECGDESEVKHQSAHFNNNVIAQVASMSPEALGNQTSLPPANALKAFSLFHQFF